MAIHFHQFSGLTINLDDTSCWLSLKTRATWEFLAATENREDAEAGKLTHGNTEHNPTPKPGEFSRRVFKYRMQVEGISLHLHLFSYGKPLNAQVLSEVANHFTTGSRDQACKCLVAHVLTEKPHGAITQHHLSATCVP